MSLKVSLLVSLAVIEMGCYRTWPPPRPQGVPAEAVWAGGLDGGSWILCGGDTTRNVNTCSVWNDQNGALAETGDYRLLKEGRAASNSELKYEWADRAGWIGLQNGLVLDNMDHRHPR